MLKLFEKSTVFQVVFIFVATALLWSGTIADPQPMEPASGFAPLYALLCSLSLLPTLCTVVAMVLVVLCGYFFNLMLTHVGLASQNSLLPTLLFITAASASETTLSPMLIASLITIAVVNLLLLRSTLLTVSADKIFGAAALIGIASMIYLPSLTLIVAYLLIAVNYRLYSWRDWMVFLLGLLAPYLSLWAVLLFTDDLVPSFEAIAADFSSISVSLGTFTPLQAVANGFLVLVFVLSLIIVWRRLGEKTIVWQKNATTLMLITLAAVAMLPLGQFFPVRLHFFAIPFAFCVTQRLGLVPRASLATRRTSWHSHLYDLLLILIVIAAILC
ncbi:MAG: hypothetical protein IJ634_08500 [Bacteroidales bacterium]|nr:hypothetical protein [Bacteroidales bacterium]